jgi:hypothetical protein
MSPGVLRARCHAHGGRASGQEEDLSALDPRARLRDNPARACATPNPPRRARGHPRKAPPFGPHAAGGMNRQHEIGQPP